MTRTAGKKKSKKQHAKKAPAKKKATPRYVTQAAYAKMRKVSKQAINKLVSSGKLSLVGRMIDVRQADAIRSASNRAPARNAAARKPPASDQGGGIVSATKRLTAARAEETQYKAKAARFDYETKIGLYVLKSEVLKAEQRKNETIRGKFLSAHRDIAALYQPGMTRAELEDLVRVEIRRRLEQLARDPLGMSSSSSVGAPVDDSAAATIAAEIAPPAEQAAEASA